MLERDYEHQLDWLAAVKEVEAAQEQAIAVPAEFPHFEDKEK